MRRISIVMTLIAVFGMALTACGENVPEAIVKIAVSEARNETTHEMWVGDELLPQLPAPAAGQPEWVLTGAPDAAILAGGSSYTFKPSSEERQRGAYVEFDFIATGPGETSLTITRGPADAPLDSFTMDVKVNDRNLTEVP